MARNIYCMALLLLFVLTPQAIGDDWARFRGKQGLGISQDKGIPTEWSEDDNLVWKHKLPGSGSSSPIVIGDKVFVTCHAGSASDLTRHLFCLDKASGKQIWDKKISAINPEDSFRGFIQEHGYASSTPTSDGKMVYVFLGKSGVYAFDLEGNQKWHAPVGTQSSNRRWGSAASPILYNDKLIVNAGE